MKARLVLACAVAGVAVSAFGGATASAQDAFTGTIEFMPDTVQPGGSVSISATCSDTKVTEFPVSSPILEPAVLRREEGGTLPLFVHATVKADAAQEIWPVSFTCGGELVQGHLRVFVKGANASIRIVDREIRPGQEVRIAAMCDDPKFLTSKVISSVLTAPDLQPDPNVADIFVLAATGRINSDAKPGTHSLAFMCAGKEVSGTFTILGEPAAAPVKAQVPVKPKGAAETGEMVSQPVEETSSSTALVLGGAGALLASAGAGVWLLRRRQGA